MTKELKLTFSLSELATLLSEPSDSSRAEIVDTLKRAADDCEAINPEEYSGSDAATQLVVKKLHDKAALMRRRKEARKQDSYGADPNTGEVNPPKGFKMAITFADVSDILYVYRRRGALVNHIIPTMRALAKRTGHDTLAAISDALTQMVNFVDQIFPEITYLKAWPHIPRILTIYLRHMHPIRRMRLPRRRRFSILRRRPP